jgi:hypothetical protein
MIRPCRTANGTAIAALGGPSGGGNLAGPGPQAVVIGVYAAVWLPYGEPDYGRFPSFCACMEVISFDDEVNKLLDLDGTEESVVYMSVVGVPA